MLEILKYGVAGLLNTAVGYAVFWCAFRYFGATPAWANAIGYGIALVLSYCLNVFWVFAAAKRSRGSALRFILAFGVSFLVNQLVLFALVQRAHMAPTVAQLFAMLSYTAVFFLLSKFFVFQQISRPRA